MKSLHVNLVIIPMLLLILKTGNIPYGTMTKPQPAGNDFSKLIPLKVGTFKRVSYTPPAPGLDGEAIYRSGDKEIFMLFSKADSKEDLKETMQTILQEIKENKTTEARNISLKTPTPYIHFLGPKIAFFAWARQLYCFSADSKNGDKKTLEEFMTAFPY